MNELSPPWDSAVSSERLALTDSNPSLRANLSALAQLAAATCAADACLISWRDSRASGTVRFPGSRAWIAPLAAIQSAVERRFDDASAPATSAVHLGPLAVVLPEPKAGSVERRCEIYACAAAADSYQVTVALAVPAPSASFEAFVALITENALRIIALDEHARSREFWRRRALDAGERLALARVELRKSTSDRDWLDQAVAAALKLHRHNRFAGLGAIFARSGQFGGWIIAINDADGLRPVAASALGAAPSLLGSESALAECVRLGSPLLRNGNSPHPASSDEDRMFAPFTSYLCVPFDGGAIGLGARRAIDPDAVRRCETLAARIGPLVKCWVAEAEAHRLQQLVRSLGLRMFAAVDSERARIARDLHDHQAQLLAAARIALEAGPDEARGIFKQIEEALRLRVRELRPATLGRSSLEDGLRYELRRLTDAGIKGRLLRVRHMKTLTRPVQHLCYQVAREALSNVLRHSGATRVEISLDKQQRRVHLTIRDNGKGLGAGDPLATTGRNSGIGLNGLRERLELMGGRLRIDSSVGSTVLTAEIPEPV